MRRILQAFGAPRVTVALMLTLGGVLLAGLWIPQKAVLSRDLYLAWRASSPGIVRALEALGLTDLYRSPVVSAVWALFFANLLVAIGLRTPGILRRARLTGEIPPPGDLGGSHRARLEPGGAGALSVAETFFARRGFVVQRGAGRLRAVRHRWSPVATLLFHLSFLVILAGGTLTLLTRFDGWVHLGEGEAFQGSVGQYEGRPRVASRARWPEDRFTVERILPEYEGGKAVGVRVELREGGGALRSLEINRPYDSPSGVSYVFRDLGLAPVLVLTDADGRELIAGAFRLDVMNGRVDTLRLRDLAIRVELFPDWYEEGGEDRTRGREVRNPVLRLTSAEKGAAPPQRLALDGEVALGPYRLHFVDWVYWVKLYVRSERGVGVLFAGFGLATLALAWRLLFYRRDYVLEATSAGVEVAARADYYDLLFAEEFKGTLQALRDAWPAEPGRGA